MKLDENIVPAAVEARYKYYILPCESNSDICEFWTSFQTGRILPKFGDIK